MGGDGILFWLGIGSFIKIVLGILLRWYCCFDGFNCGGDLIVKSVLGFFEVGVFVFGFKFVNIIRYLIIL